MGQSEKEYDSLSMYIVASNTDPDHGIEQVASQGITDCAIASMAADRNYAGARGPRYSEGKYDCHAPRSNEVQLTGSTFCCFRDADFQCPNDTVQRGRATDQRIQCQQLAVIRCNKSSNTLLINKPRSEV